MQFRGWSLLSALALVLSGVPAHAEVVPTFSLVLTKTVGVGPGCATTDTIEVPVGTEVNYCYQVQNTGNTTLSGHTLVDDVLGTLVGPDEVADLFPGQVRQVNASTVINVTTMNTATWTAMTGTLITYYVGYGASSPAVVATAMDSALVNVPETGDDACSDGLDNNDNGIIDCADPSCAGTAVCRAQVPVVSSTGLFVIALVLLLVGNLALVAHRRRS